MKRAILPSLGLAAVLTAALLALSTGGAEAKPDHCLSTQVALANHRAMQVGLRAAYRISVEYGYDYNVSKLGPRMIAGELETSRLLAKMYQECGLSAT